MIKNILTIIGLVVVEGYIVTSPAYAHDDSHHKTIAVIAAAAIVLAVRGGLAVAGRILRHSGSPTGL